MKEIYADRSSSNDDLEQKVIIRLRYFGESPWIMATNVMKNKSPTQPSQTHLLERPIQVLVLNKKDGVSSIPVLKYSCLYSEWALVV